MAQKMLLRARVKHPRGNVSLQAAVKCFFFRLRASFYDALQSTAASVANVVVAEVAAIAVAVAAVDVPSISTARRAKCTISLPFPLTRRDLTL